jgi:hypothetical protein
MLFSLALDACTAATGGALLAAREVGRGETVEEGVASRAEVAVAGRAKAVEGVVAGPTKEDDEVDPRPPDEVLAGR